MPQGTWGYSWIRAVTATTGRPVVPLSCHCHRRAKIVTVVVTAYLTQPPRQNASLGASRRHNFQRSRAPVSSGFPGLQQHSRHFATAYGTPTAPHPTQMWLPPGHSSAAPSTTTQRGTQAAPHRLAIRATCPTCATRTLWPSRCSMHHRETGPPSNSISRSLVGGRAQLLPL